MSEYSEIEAIKEARLYLRHYIYDDTTIPYFTGLLKNTLPCAYSLYERLDDGIHQIKLYFNKDVGIPNLIEYRGITIANILQLFLQHPIVTEVINRCSQATTEGALNKIRNARDEGARISYLYQSVIINTEPDYDIIVIQL